MGADAIRILLADEQALFREAVKVILSSESDLEVVGEAKDGLEAVLEAERTQPDVALLDADLPNCDTLRATSMIRERAPGCRIVVLVPDEDEDSLIDVLEAGASGYLSKACPLVELINATRSIYQGETLIPKRMLGALLARLISRRRVQEEGFRKVRRLTRREREVLALLGRGADNQGIAQALVISPHTARTHIQNVIAKLGVHSRLEAAALVMQNGMLEELVAVDG